MSDWAQRINLFANTSAHRTCIKSKNWLDQYPVQMNGLLFNILSRCSCICDLKSVTLQTSCTATHHLTVMVNFIMQCVSCAQLVLNYGMLLKRNA